MKEKEAPERFSLSRWSRRKIEAKSDSATPIAAPASTPAPATAAPANAAPSPSAPVATELPSVDSLTFDSDFTAFLRPEVDDTLKRAALKQLFRDPRFNVMDGLDVYIDDYTKADPIPPNVLKDMLRRFAAVATPATPSAEPSGSMAESAEAVPATSASQSLPPTATPSAASSPESQSPQLPAQLPESAPEPTTAPRSTS
jgi:hypothetical protein